MSSMIKTLVGETSDCDHCLAGVFSLQHPHKSSWHVFKAFSDVFLILQFPLQRQNREVGHKKTRSENAAC